MTTLGKTWKLSEKQIKRRNITRRKNGWFKDIKETKKKMPKSQKGNKYCLGHKNHLGHHHIKKTKKRISIKLKNKSKSIEHRKNIHLNHFRGKESWNWKGDKVGYQGVHKWLRNNIHKPKLCQKCHKEKKLELANISGKYKRDIADYKWLCHSCHRKFDVQKNG